MDKEKILEMARVEKVDEGLKYADYKGLYRGYLVFYGLVIFIGLFNIFTNQKSSQIFAILWGFNAIRNYEKFRFTLDKSDRNFALANAILSLLSLLDHLARSL